MIANDVAHMLAKALTPRQRQDAPEVTSGTVTRTDTDGTVWVRLFGADDDTPCTGSTAAAKPGDVVTVTIDGGSARVDGNVTAPATDDARADEAVRMTERVAEDVVEVRESAASANAAAVVARVAASEAQAVAEATGQHFWADDGGIHVTEAEGDAATEHNILVNSLGILLRVAATNLVSITQGAIAFYDGVGNAASNLLAQFGTTGATLYAGGAKVADFGASGMAVGSFTNLGNLWRGASITSAGVAVGTIGGTTGQFPTASNYSIVAGGSSQTVTRGSGGGATVVGFECSATDHSIAVGTGARATGSGSAAFGDAVTATGDNQLVIGKYNETDTTKAFIIGNGVMDDGETGTVKSNAFSIDWDGTLYSETPVPIASGGTEATSAAGARTSLGITPANIGAVADVDDIGAKVDQLSGSGQLWCLRGTIDNSSSTLDGHNIGLYTVDDGRLVLYDFTAGSAVWAMDGIASESAPTLSNATATTFVVRRARPTCTLYVGELKVSAQLANGSSVSLGSNIIPSGYRPAYNTGVQLSSSTSNAAKGVWLYVTSAGSVTLYNRSGNALTTSATLYGALTYVL